MDISIGTEQDMRMWGENVYIHSHRFPKIIINKENSEEYLNYFNVAYKIFDESSQYLLLLFAEICSLFEKHSPEEISLVNEATNDYFLKALAICALSRKQSNDIINQIKSTESLTLSGENYCFIIMMLSNLLSYYSACIILIQKNKYIDNEIFVNYRGNLSSQDSTLRRGAIISSSNLSLLLSLTISKEFEELRKQFKVLECYNSLPDSFDTKDTVH